MCDRYTIKTSPKELQEEFAELPIIEPRYNLAPTQAAPILTAATPRLLTIARWGLIPPWAKDPSIASTNRRTMLEGREGGPVTATRTIRRERSWQQ